MCVQLHFNFDEDRQKENTSCMRLKDNLRDIFHLNCVLLICENSRNVLRRAVVEEQKGTDIQPDVTLDAHFIEDITGYTAHLSDR